MLAPREVAERHPLGALVVVEDPANVARSDGPFRRGLFLSVFQAKPRLRRLFRLPDKRESMNYPDFDDAVYINKRVLSSQKIGMLSSGNLRYCLDAMRSTGTMLTEKTAFLIYCVIRNHPFLDGNKRSAYQIAETFLLLNGYTLSGMWPQEVIDKLTGVANGRVDRISLEAWLKTHLKVAE
ncbi:MAG: type II toxin-antitoxin system death-on-curing family toxin [Thaumarchaeota archaeon]|nr:type II toxin-antitoxin system death-on-curing family toxin [Nitrososphaerota archaeon]